MPEINIGCSGWQYGHWQNFYPKDYKGDLFNYYASQFDTVEINSTFYNMPKEQVFNTWYNKAPEGFKFTLKMYRLVTHNYFLHNTSLALEFIKRARLLKEKLGIILVQLPPRWHYDPQAIPNFTEAMPQDIKLAFELRNPTWLKPKGINDLRQSHAGFVIYDFNHYQTADIVTTDYAYYRLHGPEGKYTGSYSDEYLLDLTSKIIQHYREGRDIWVYFDNDQNAYAPQNALTLKKMVAQFLKG